MIWSKYRVDHVQSTIWEVKVVRPEAVTVTVGGSALVVSYPQIKTAN